MYSREYEDELRHCLKAKQDIEAEFQRTGDREVRTIQLDNERNRRQIWEEKWGRQEIYRIATKSGKAHDIHMLYDDGQTTRSWVWGLRCGESSNWVVRSRFQDTLEQDSDSYNGQCLASYQRCFPWKDRDNQRSLLWEVDVTNRTLPRLYAVVGGGCHGFLDPGLVLTESGFKTSTLSNCCLGDTTRRYTLDQEQEGYCIEGWSGSMGPGNPYLHLWNKDN